MKGFLQELAARSFRFTRPTEAGSEASGDRLSTQTAAQHSRAMVEQLPPRDEGLVSVWQHWHH